jgi:hypothetical protein
MIPIIVFVVLALTLIPLFLYAFIDHRNKLYGNIVAAFLCSIIALYLAVVISIGIVQYDPLTTFNGTFETNVSECLQWETINNDTRECIEFNNYTVTNIICRTCNGVPVVDASMGYIFMLISVIMMVYSLYMVYEAYDEYKLQKEED